MSFHCSLGYFQGLYVVGYNGISWDLMVILWRFNVVLMVFMGQSIGKRWENYRKMKVYPLVITNIEKTTIFFMGKSTVSMVIFQFAM